MKEITVKLYSFDELSDEAKEKVFEQFRNSNAEYFPQAEEAKDSLNKFCKIFSIDWRNIDYSEPYRNDYRFNLDENILELSGYRLSKYIWNNYKSDIFKGKYYSLWSKTKVNYKYYKEGHPELIQRESKVQLDDCCVLTGVCYDDYLLSPIYEFLRKPNNNIDFETLLNDCIYNLCASVNSEYEYQNSDEGLTEDIKANDYLFTEDGKLY